MKKLITAIAVTALVVIPYNLVNQLPTFAAGELPVEKTLVAEIETPWQDFNVPKAEDFKVFSCGERIYMVWQEQISGAAEGQKSSKFYALWSNGYPLNDDWLAMAADSEHSVVRFTGTCISERAVMTNSWENTKDQTAGFMATSINGEETIGPLWYPDGKTVYWWYKTNGNEWGFDSRFNQVHLLSTTWDNAQFNGRVFRVGDTVGGSSANYVLDAGGYTHVMHSPWLKDVANVELANDKALDIHFWRYADGWRAVEYTLNKTVGTRVLIDDNSDTGESVKVYDRKDYETEWREMPAKETACLIQGNDYNALEVHQDGLYFKPGSSCDSNGMIAATGESRIHVAESEDLQNEPRIYTNDKVRGNSGETFVYAVRTGDNKLQIWKAIVK